MVDDRWIAGLAARIRRLAESGDYGVVLDPSAIYEIAQLWESVRPEEGNLDAIPLNSLAVLAYFHLLRCQLVPRDDISDLQTALSLLLMLAVRAPHLVPYDIRQLLTAGHAESEEDAGRLATDWAPVLLRYRPTEPPDALNVAITAFCGAAAVSDLGSSDHALFQSELAGALVTRFERTGDFKDLDAAIDAGQQAVAAASPGDPSLARYLSNLGGWLSRRFAYAGNVADLDAAIDVGQRAIALTSSEHGNRAMPLSNLGSALLDRFKQRRDYADLAAAVEALNEAIAAIPADNSDRAIPLTNLGNALLARFEWGGDITDLNAAIEAARQALIHTPSNHPNRAMYLSNLSNALTIRFERSGDNADLAAAVDAAQHSVAETPPDHPDRARWLTILGGILLTRFGQTGDSTDLEAAINITQQAVALSGPGQPRRAGLLSNLGNALLARFEQTGDNTDLDAAIDAGQQAVAATPPGYPNRAMYLSNLGSALGRRFERDRDGADLDAAIDAESQAVNETSTDYYSHATYLSNLSASLLTRFRWAQDRTDLDAAIKAGERAVAATSPGHPALATMLSNVAGSFLARYEQVGVSTDVDAAIDAAQRAVAVASAGDPDRPMYLTNLTSTLLRRFERDGNRADLDAAITNGRQAVSDTLPGHPNSAPYLLNLAACFQVRFRQIGARADLDTAIDCWRSASHVPTAAPGIRLTAAQRWASAAAHVGLTHEAAEGYSVAVGLLPQAAWHGLDRATREGQLAQWAGLAADAAASAVLDGYSRRPVELLEQGRSVLWAQALNLRSDLTRLAQKHPGLAERLDNIRAILDTSIPEEIQTSTEQVGGTASTLGRAQQDAIELRRRKAREWDDVVTQVRMLEGFEHFLAATPYPELAAAAAEGPVVIVNASSQGCHALAVDADAAQPRVVNLPDLTLDATIAHANQLLEVLARAASPRRPFPEREHDRHAVLDILRWLWDVVAEPVLTALGHTSKPAAGDTWPRVWWCPTGPLTVLPLHAAGHHPRLRTTAARSADCVLDRVISSYTPTLSALARTHQLRPSAPLRHLGVGMPTTPGQPPLPAVPAEMEVLARYFPPGSENQQLVESQATRASVLAAVADHSWLHMACHAGQEHTDPDRSGFALWDGTLTLTDLADQPTQHRNMAFLSACQTATGSFRHLDEAIHLAAAMQFLGYRHVIATMWTIADSPAPYVADSVYNTLTLSNNKDPDRAAGALHQAVHALRDADPTDPLLWASYIHLGP